jgi:hypothetical protein
MLLTTLNLHTSFKKKKIPENEQKRNTALMMFGAAYGYFFIHCTFPKMPGYDFAGSARRPPIIGPIITPMLKQIGKRRNALD